MPGPSDKPANWTHESGLEMIGDALHGASAAPKHAQGHPPKHVQHHEKPIDWEHESGFQMIADVVHNSFASGPKTGSHHHEKPIDWKHESGLQMIADALHISPEHNTAPAVKLAHAGAHQHGAPGNHSSQTSTAFAAEPVTGTEHLAKNNGHRAGRGALRVQNAAFDHVPDAKLGKDGLPLAPIKLAELESSKASKPSSGIDGLPSAPIALAQYEGAAPLGPNKAALKIESAKAATAEIPTISPSQETTMSDLPPIKSAEKVLPVQQANPRPGLSYNLGM